MLCHPEPRRTARDLTSYASSGLLTQAHPLFVRSLSPKAFGARDDKAFSVMPTPQDAQEIEWEVLPPEEKEKRSELEPLFRWLALVMDNFFRCLEPSSASGSIR